MIILAAGQGTRLQPLTDDRPKCMVEVQGKSMLAWQIETARGVGVDSITVVRGYKEDIIDFANVHYLRNPVFDSTNMVETLWCAEASFGEEFIVSYGDIIYEKRILQGLLSDKHDIAVVVDKAWQALWSKRFENVLDDAETLKINEKGLISEIGQIPSSIDDIHAQYIGLMAFRGEGIKALRTVYEKAQKDGQRGLLPLRGQRPFNNLYMTDILQGLVDEGYAVNAVPVQHGWLEVDSVEDLKLAERLILPDKESFTIQT